MLEGGPVQYDGVVVDAPAHLQLMEFPNYESGPQPSCVLRYRSQMGATVERDGDRLVVLRFAG